MNDETLAERMCVAADTLSELTLLYGWSGQTPWGPDELRHAANTLATPGGDAA